MNWDVIEIKVELPLSLRVPFHDGTRGIVRFEPSYLAGVAMHVSIQIVAKTK